MNGGPADPWRGEGGFLDTVLDGALVTAQIAALLDRDDDGVDAALRGLEALSVDDLRSAVFAAAADKMLDDRRRRGKREQRARLTRPWRWRPRRRLRRLWIAAVRPARWWWRRLRSRGEEEP